jgi:putative heme-binding domain-containing protein
VKVREGYVGRAVPIASLSMLAIDCAISPKGDLVVCCHSGPPDWGTGPTGKGKLFKISYVDDRAPQPVIAWPANKDEIRVAFDRPVDKSVETRLAGLSVACGEYVRAADRLETLRPPYAAVKAQMATPPRTLSIASAKLSEDARTLAIKLAEPMPWRTWYALTVPGIKAPGARGLGESVDLDFPMAGAMAYLNDHNAGHPVEFQRPWMPHLSSDVAFELNRGSADHDRLAEQLTWRDLHADLQVNAKLDLPGKRATLTFASDRPFRVQGQSGTGGFDLKVDAKGREEYAGSINVRTGGELVPMTVSIDVTNARAVPKLSVTYTTDQNATPRPVPLESVLPVWAPTARQPVVTAAAPSPLVRGGNWAAGKALFFGEAKCGACHTVRGEGGAIGPNLSNLVYLNAESVLKDIVEPSARINPDHVSYLVTTDAGDTLAGLVRREGEDLVVTEGIDKAARVPAGRVTDLRPSKISLMPDGYKSLGDEKLRDLLTFLTTEGKSK